jgi:MFS transporter, DHA1 family, multidrug resistance protein
MMVNRRILISASTTFSTMVVTFTSAIFATTIPVLEKRYNVSREIALLGVALYVLGFAFGPSIWAPLSELKGRRIAFVPSMAGFVVFSFATGSSQNMASILVFRFLGGLFGAGPLTLAGPINADIFVGKPLGISMVLFAFMVFAGPVLAQPIGGFIVINGSLGWRWTEYICGILGGAALLSLVVVLKETSAPVILVRKARKLRKDNPNSSFIAHREAIKITWKVLVVDFLGAPLRLLTTDPIVLLMSLFGSFVYALLYLFLVGYPIVFQQIHRMRPGVGGLPYLGLVVGQICAVAGIFAMQPWIMKKARQNNGKIMPEWQLPVAVPGAIAFSLGIFWFGWSGYRRDIHWIVPTLSGVFSGFGLLATFVPSITYLVQVRSDT